MKKWITYTLMLLSFSTSSFSSSSWHGRIFYAPTQEEISITDLTFRLSKARTIILGETHNTPAIQLAESIIIHDTVTMSHHENTFITAWEFLNYPDQEKINAAYADFLSGKIDATGFLFATQGHDKNKSYIPLLDITKALHGNIIGINISREAKEPVIHGGIEALDPQYLPPNFAMGSPGYHQRFIDTMEEHAPKDLIENYYAAQCLTDDIMAFTLQKAIDTPLLFLITGSFHAEYYDGVVNRLQVRLADKSIAVIQFIDASDFDEKELNKKLPELLHDKIYGNYADYVYFVNEPNSH